jgi:hypothetical protein
MSVPLGDHGPSNNEPSRKQQRWSGIEVGAAALMTVGMVLLPVIGPLLGLGLAWLSSYWTTREKIVVTGVVLALVALPIVLDLRASA